MAQHKLVRSTARSRQLQKVLYRYPAQMLGLKDPLRANHLDDTGGEGKVDSKAHTLRVRRGGSDGICLN